MGRERDDAHYKGLAAGNRPVWEARLRLDVDWLAELLREAGAVAQYLIAEMSAG